MAEKFRQLDWTTCDAFAIIDHSMLMHPSLFLDQLQAAINAHHDYSMRCYDSGMRIKCTQWAKESARAMRRLRNDISACVACDTWHNTIECFNVAASLQLIPARVKAEIIERTLPKSQA